MHKNKINGKIYIGKTNNIKNRWRKDGKGYCKKDSKSLFWNAICKYGWDNFEHIIIEDGLTSEEAIEKEIFYISKYDSTNREKGYNISKGGNGGKVYKEHPKGMLGKKQSQKGIEASRRNAKKASELGLNTNWKNGHPKGMLGKHHTEEFKQKLKERPSHEHPSSKKVKVIYPNGDEIVFDCVKYCREFLGLNAHIIADLIKSGKPYKLPKGNMPLELLEKRCKLIGIRIIKLDNTEVTN